VSGTEIDDDPGRIEHDAAHLTAQGGGDHVGRINLMNSTANGVETSAERGQLWRVRLLCQLIDRQLLYELT
jgi:hypothetical protein